MPGRHNALIHFPKPDAPKLLIIAHMDTVSARGMEDPFSGKIRDNNIYGRGACDDKGPLAAAFATLLNSRQDQIPFVYDVTFAGTVDEEVTIWIVVMLWLKLLQQSLLKSFMAGTFALLLSRQICR